MERVVSGARCKDEVRFLAIERSSPVLLFYVVSTVLTMSRIF